MLGLSKSQKLVLLIAGVALVCSAPAVAFAQTPEVNPVQSAIGLVIAVSGLLAALGAIAGTIIGAIRASTGDKIISQQTADKATNILNSLHESDLYIVQHRQELTAIAEAITTLSPQAKDLLEAKGINIENLKQSIVQDTDEINRLHEELTKLVQAKKTT